MKGILSFETWHINKLVSLLSRRSQGSGGAETELQLFQVTTESIPPSWPPGTMCQWWSFKHFTASNQLFSFAQQYRYVPINFYNRIKKKTTQTKQYDLQTPHPPPPPCLKLSEVGNFVNRSTFGYWTFCHFQLSVWRKGSKICKIKGDPFAK